LTAETTGRRVSITEHDGTNKTLVGLYQGKPLNSPNDVVVKSDGTVWFTDPSYGCLQFPQECYLPNNVYRLIGKLRMPKETANLTFGGKDNNILFICSSDSIWAIKLNAKGAKPIPEIRP